MDDEFNYPHSKQTKPLIIFGGSMHGKSTAHNKGLGHDIESPPPNGYSEWSEKYEEFSAAEDTWKVTRDKSKLKARDRKHTSELQSHHDLVCRLLLEKKKKKNKQKKQKKQQKTKKKTKDNS